VLAPVGEKNPNQTWTTVQIDAGDGSILEGKAATAGGQTPHALRVWSYHGRPVYTFSGDAHPGDINGDRILTLPIAGWTMLSADNQR